MRIECIDVEVVGTGSMMIEKLAFVGESIGGGW
jgi:hypothetical protein